MAWPESLAPTQQAAVEQFALDCRAWAAKLAKLNTYGAAIGAAYYAGINANLAALPDNRYRPKRKQLCRFAGPDGRRHYQSGGLGIRSVQSGERRSGYGSICQRGHSTDLRQSGGH